MLNAKQAGAIDAFTAWRQIKKFVVGGPLLSRKALKASARELMQCIKGRRYAPRVPGWPCGIAVVCSNADEGTAGCGGERRGAGISV